MFLDSGRKPDKTHKETMQTPFKEPSQETRVQTATPPAHEKSIVIMIYFDDQIKNSIISLVKSLQ